MIDVKNVSMDTIINKLLTGEISVKDLIQWLQTNNSDIKELNLIQNFEFIPFFLNYVKYKCSWVSSNDKAIDVTDHGNLKTSPVTVKSNEQSENERDRKHDRAHNHSHDNQINGRLTLNHSTENILNKKPFTCKDNINYKDHIKTLDPYKPENTKRYVSSPKVVQRTPDIQNFNAFPPLSAKIDDTKTRRRITPTPVQKASNCNAKFEKSRFSTHSVNITNEVFKSPTFQDNRFDLKYERELLKVTRSTLPKQSTIPENNVKTKFSDIKCNQIKTVDQFVFPDPLNINMINEILSISEIYSYLLREALIPNITTELYFLFELITAKVSQEKNADEKNIFGSIHNCVFFAVSILGNQCNLLQMFDNATLASLKEIPYLVKFSPQLIDYMCCCTLSKHDDSPVLPSLTVVPFQLEDDSRSNFPDEYSFVCFKKQRDLFYEMLREWQLSMDNVDDKFKSNFLRKVRLLINLGPNSINMFHLARLFQSQLIASCMCLEVNEVYDELLNDIQKNHPDKFKKLQERFLTPSNTNGLNPLPSFYGIQTFFSELIFCANSPSLNQHLINVFICKILEMNNTDIFSDKELSTLETVKDKYVFLLHTLRLLGKFLGYIYFFPYTKEESIPEHIMKQQAACRQHFPPPLDFSNLLRESVKNNHVIITVPWVVEYLSMVDPIGKTLADVQETLCILIRIYQCKNIFPRRDVHSHLFLQIIIGWLFEVLHFPINFVKLVQPASELFLSTGYGIDSLSIIDKQLIHSCCPYLIEFKVLVYNFLNGIKDKKREVRKITPLSTSTSNVPNSSITNKRQLEYHMEENFFSLHPSSVKKTTEFVSERMASKVISKIRSEVTKVKLNIVEDLTNGEHKICTTDQAIKRDDIDKILETKVTKAFSDLKDMISYSIKNICSEIHSIIPALLSEDSKLIVINMCCKISIRMAVDKILDWGNANLLYNAIKADIQNKIQYNSKPDNNIEVTDNLNTSDWINVLRNIIAKVQLPTSVVDLGYIQSLFAKMDELQTNISIAIQKNIFLLSIDLYISILVNHPGECCEEVNDSFIQFWSKCPKYIMLGKAFLSLKNLKLLLNSKNIELSQMKFLVLVKLLLTSNIACADDLNSFMKYMKETQSNNFKHLYILDKGLNELSI